MRKHLLVLSALGFAAAAAHAQSSVTLFGILDATLAHGSGSISKKTQLGSGGNNTSRLGFRGVEDLGGGLSAGFHLEAAVFADDGRGGPANTNNQASGAGPSNSGLTFARRSTVSLAGPWGEFRAGRDYVPQYWGMSRGDPFGNVGVGTAVNYSASIVGVTTVRASNALHYISPNFGGFSASVMHYRGENNSGTATSDDGTGSGMRLQYENGPLSGGIGYGRTEYASGDAVERNIQAQWNFKVARVMGVINRDRLGTLSSKGFTIGAVVPVGVGEFKAAYSGHRTDAAGEPKAKKLALGYVHNLSKRTAIYFTAARLKNSGGLAMALNGATTAPNSSSTGYDLGLRHSF